MNESFFQKLKRVRLVDYWHIVLFFAAILPAIILRLRRRHIWLICEGKTEARDNGFYFFKYLNEKQPQIDSIYAIDYHCSVYGKVSKIGNTIPFGTYKHWVYYLASEVNVSSQKYGNPNAAVCYLLEIVLGLLRKKKVFLQHGVIKDDLPFLHYDKAKFSMFCCSAQREFEFVRDNFGYPAGAVQKTGLCRFDALYNADVVPRTVLVMPTWRMDLQRNCVKEEFIKTEYYCRWNALLNDKAFIDSLERNDATALFCVHREMKAFEDLFQSASSRITVTGWDSVDVSWLIQTSACLITDFSSVYMDFAYMRKPVIYYQFDTESYRAGHLPKGYFDYDDDGFGPICSSTNDVADSLIHAAENNWQPDEVYKNRSEEFFPRNDGKNCLRTYLAIMDMLSSSRD